MPLGNLLLRRGAVELPLGIPRRAQQTLLKALSLGHLGADEGRPPIVLDAELNRLHAGVLMSRDLRGDAEAQRAEPRWIEPVDDPKPERSSRDRFNHGVAERTDRDDPMGGLGREHPGTRACQVVPRARISGVVGLKWSSPYGVISPDRPS